MNGINKVILVGNVGSVDVKNTVTRVSLATSESFKDKSGEKKTETHWHKCVFFGRLAEIAAQYVKKGDKLYLEGQLKYGKYQDDKGVERYTTDVVVRSMQMLGGTLGGHKDGGAPHQKQKDDFLEDDLPF